MIRLKSDWPLIHIINSQPFVVQTYKDKNENLPSPISILDWHNKVSGSGSATRGMPATADNHPYFMTITNTSAPRYCSNLHPRVSYWPWTNVATVLERQPLRRFSRYVIPRSHHFLSVDLTFKIQATNSLQVWNSMHGLRLVKVASTYKLLWEYENILAAAQTTCKLAESESLSRAQQ